MTAYCEMNDYRKTGAVQQPRLMIPVGIYINRGDWQYIYVTTESEAAGYFYHNSSERLKRNFIRNMFHALLTRKESSKGLKLGEQAGIGHDEQNSRHRHVLCRSQC